MVDVPGGASGLLVRDYKGKEADRLVTRISHGVALLVAGLCGHERQAAEQFGPVERDRVRHPILSVSLQAGSDLRSGGPTSGLPKITGWGKEAFREQGAARQVDVKP
jgi:hypothetical protein